MPYGNPDKPNKYETEVAQVVRQIERHVREHYTSLGLDPPTRVDPETYYDESGNPSRFLEVKSDRRQDFRLAVQRNMHQRRWKWELDFAEFRDGLRVNEVHLESTTPGELLPEITSILRGYKL
jgi:hypothetical protein